jgi:hypothetical protein
MIFKSAATEVGETVSQQQAKQIARWKKERENGKWFWVFKRAAAWLTLMIVMFGAVKFYSPETLNFDGDQFFIAIFMFSGFFIGSIREWSNLEKQLDSMPLTND